MKKIVLMLIISLFVFSSIHAQKRFHKEGREYKFNKVMELEKIKLIETLNLSEETSVRFFTRRANHVSEQMELINQKDSLLQELAVIIKSGKASDDLYNKKFSTYMDLENKIMNGRNKFFNSLSDILTPEQRAKLIVFEFMFRKEIKDEVMKRRK